MVDPSSQAVEAAKRALRLEIRARMMALDSEIRAAADAQIRNSIAKWLPKTHGGVVCGFLPLRNEPDLRPLLKHLLSSGIRVGVPDVVPGDAPTLRVLEVKHANDLDSTQPSAHGTSVPVSSRGVEASELAVVLVPGVAFDLRGGRLGRGRGYFDAFLASISDHITTVGVAYGAQVVEEVPRGAHDVPVDCLCTERGVVTAG